LVSAIVRDIDAGTLTVDDFRELCGLPSDYGKA
jgi:hypothetical protein